MEIPLFKVQCIWKKNPEFLDYNVFPMTSMKIIFVNRKQEHYIYITVTPVI